MSRLARSLLTAGLVLAVLPAAAQDVTPDDAQRLQRLLVQDCGSCHGLRMKGGLGPALTPERLRERPQEALLATILQGRPGTAMPPWSALLSEPEARWMLDQLLHGLEQ